MRRAAITAAEKKRTSGELASVNVREKDWSHAPNAEKTGRSTLLREGQHEISRTASPNSDDALQTTGYRRAATSYNLQAATTRHFLSYNDTHHTIGGTVGSDEDSCAEVSPPPLLPDEGTTGDREIACLASPPSILNGTFGTESHSPHRRRDMSQRRWDIKRSSLLVHEAAVKTAVEREEDPTKFFEGYRCLGFVERQELEQIAARRRREELLRAEEEARCQLASGGRCMSRSSRTILARSSSAPPCGGGGGRSSSLPRDAGDRGRGPSVFERLARCASDNHVKDYCGYDTGTWMLETAIDGEDDRTFDRHPFQPTIDPRSSLIASKVTRRNKDGHGCPLQRLYRDGQEQVRRRERRIQLADKAIREKAVSCHVSLGSERVLARRSRLRFIRFRSKIMEVLKVRSAHKYSLEPMPHAFGSGCAALQRKL